jgi:transcription initiation factor IIE alpha subunit
MGESKMLHYSTGTPYRLCNPKMTVYMSSLTGIKEWVTCPKCRNMLSMKRTTSLSDVLTYYLGEE